jgi:hypothetical protein
MEPIKAPNLSLLTKSHENKWVAFTMNYKKLVAVAESLVELRQKLGEKRVIVMKVLPRDIGYAPHIRS